MGGFPSRSVRRLINERLGRQRMHGNWRETGARPCRDSYSYPGGTESASPAPMNSSIPSCSDYVMELIQIGTQLDFLDGDSRLEYAAASKCSALGSEEDAFAICLHSEAQNAILARGQDQILLVSG